MLPAVFEDGAGKTFAAGDVLRPGRAVVAAAVLVALAAPRAEGNLRAPRVIPGSPSSALVAPAESLTVDRELLRFLCGADSCLVTAQYEVTAAAATKVHLEFILPVQSPVTATTNAAGETVQVVPAAPLRAEEARALTPALPGAPPLFRAAFQSALREGQNTVTVSYSQPLGAEEADFGYGKKGRMVQQLRYELWPLREWKRSPGFRVKLAVAIDRPSPGWWKRLFGKPRSLTCLSSDVTAPVPAGRREQREGKLWYEAELGPTVPDRITCYIGDEDLMPRY
jgi:hypothetical protein